MNKIVSIVVALVGCCMGVKGEVLTWVGGEGTDWNLKVTNTNWVDEAGNPCVFIQGSDVFFGNGPVLSTEAKLVQPQNNRPFAATTGVFRVDSDLDYKMSFGVNGKIAEMTRFEKWGSGVFEMYMNSNTMTNDFYVYDGTLRVSLGRNDGILSMGSLGDVTVPRRLYVGPNGTLEMTSICFNMQPTVEPKMVIEIDRGTLRMTQGAKPQSMGSMIFRNATIDLTQWPDNSLCAYWNGDLTFSGTNVYEMPRSPRGQRMTMSCDRAEPITITIDDVTGDAASDLIIPWSIVDFSGTARGNWVGNVQTNFVSSFAKAGAGTLALTAGGQLTGDIVIREGKVLLDSAGSTHVNYINRQEGGLGNTMVANRKVVLESGTELEFKSENQLGYFSSNPLFTLVISNATLRLPNLKRNPLPCLDLYDATIVADEGQFNRYTGQYDLITFSGRIRFDGTVPYVFTNGVHRTFSLGYSKDGDVNQVASPTYSAGITYYRGKTEMCVQDITQDHAPDVTFEAQLRDIPNDLGNNFRRFFCCGLEKTGSGTLSLTANNNNYTGVTEVVEGVLKVDGAIQASDTFVKAGGYLAGIGTISKAVVIENGGGFAADYENPEETNLVLPNLTLPEAGVLYVQNYEGPIEALRMTFQQAIEQASNFESFSSSAWSVQVEGRNEKEIRDLKVRLTDENQLQVLYSPASTLLMVK